MQFRPVAVCFLLHEALLISEVWPITNNDQLLNKILNKHLRVTDMLNKLGLNQNKFTVDHVSFIAGLHGRIVLNR